MREFVRARTGTRSMHEQVKMNRERGESSEAGERVSDHGAMPCSTSEDVGNSS